nr:AAA family ATPase [Kibdelosporangium sp. MJ126-NF4]CEL22895.1 regulatory protein [Kibdelosporangium sp. MJ126-NF4]CTQ90035.1 regulatory protein [Kibdelosporangium sp. MJ126-NF4]
MWGPSHELIGRGAELGVLRACYDRLPEVVLVSGEAGIGKSRLVSAFTAELADGPRLLGGGCLELGAEGSPYVPFLPIMRDLTGQPAQPGPGILEEMLTLVTRAAERGPVVITVEDLHWADASSRELFAYLARNLTGPVLLIGTVRTGHPNRRLIAELGRRAVTRIDLGPLAADDVIELLTAVGGERPDRARGLRVHRRSGGNPLFVEALCHADEPGDLRTLLLERVTRRAELEALAVAAAPVPDEHIAGVCGDEALAELIDRDLVVVAPDGYVIRHDLIREAVYDSTVPARRKRLHAHFAALAPDGAAAAQHWLAAGDADRALPVAWRAARAAARQNAYDEQLHLLELILAQWSDALEVDRGTVMEHAAAAALAAGKPAIGIAHSTAALDVTADPQQMARLLGLRGQLRNRADGTGIEDLEQAISLAPQGSLRGWLLAALAFVEVVANRYDSGRGHAREASRIANELADNGLLARATLVTAALDGAAGLIEQARQSFATARRLAGEVPDEHTYLTTFQWEAGLLEAVGDYGQAAELAMEGRREAERLGHGRSRGSMLAVARAVPLRLLGRWDEALELVDEAIADAPPPLHSAFLRLVAADIARCRGENARFETLMRGLAEFARHAKNAAEATLEITIQRIEWTLATGDLDQADRDLRDNLSPGHPAREVMRLAVLGARVQRARRAAAPRNRRLAHDVTARLDELTRVVDAVKAPSAYRRTFEALTTDSLSTWDSAVTAWRGLGNPYETAITLTDAATAALATNNRPGARSRLAEARELATALDAGPLIDRIDGLVSRSRLDDVAKPRAHNDFGLTRREVDVLGVLARGKSNQQIADELFISTNTVATHVARILVKLGATTRTEAVARARETDLLG